MKATPDAHASRSAQPVNAPKQKSGNAPSAAIPTAPTAIAPQRLREVLAGPLPGRAAHARYEPELAFGRHAGPPSESARPAAVAMLLYPRGDRWHIPLTVRPSHMVHHGGQISLPGGLVEPGESTADAALRELEEELGVPVADVTLLGELSPLYLFVTDFLIVPHVATIASAPQFRPSADEVAEVIELPIQTLLDDLRPRRVRRSFRALEFSAPALCMAGHEVWGATAMMLGELAAVFAAANRG